MSLIRRLTSFGVVALLGSTLAGCIVLPLDDVYGGRGRHRHYDQRQPGPRDVQPIIIEVPRGERGRR